MVAVPARQSRRARGGVEPLPGKSNYFIGNDPAKWRTNIPTYSRVRYREVYPGVDSVLYGRERRLEYDLVVAPGAKVRAIGLRFEGVKGMRIDRQGDLVLQTALGEMRRHKPLVYQEVGRQRREVTGRYVRKGRREIGFEVGDYDRSLALVIDPVLSYCTYLGGSAYDYGQSIAVDSSGQAWSGRRRRWWGS